MTNAIQTRRNNALYMMQTKNKGYGVFCEDSISTGELIEITPCILFSPSEAKAVDKTNLYNYYFSADFLTKAEAKGLNITNKAKAGVLACGVMGFCNHSADPNGEIVKYMNEEKIFFELWARRNINPHEEITVSYGEVWFDELP